MVETAEDVTLDPAIAEARPWLAEELVSFSHPSSFEADQYRGLRHRVESAHFDAGFNVFAVTSAGAGEGKTITALNLAGALAQSSENRVLVVDADLRRPSIAEYMRLPDAGLPGLSDALRGDHYQLGQLTRRLEACNISVLLTGSGTASTYELFSSPIFRGLMDEARRVYDYVLVDTPPLVPLADSRLLCRCVDGFVFVVAAHKTPRALVAEALELIDRTKIVAMAFNGDDRPMSAYYQYYGYGRPRKHRA
jgi:capsular exopolysaccharide synthesis family protein